MVLVRMLSDVEAEIDGETKMTYIRHVKSCLQEAALVGLAFLRSPNIARL